MIECPIYLVNASATTTPSTPPSSNAGCEGCNCGYLQYESLIPYLAEIRDSLNLTDERTVEFEFKLREQIVEISRLFDIAAGVTPGYFSKAHYYTTKIVPAKGTRFLKIPEFVPETLELRTMDDVLVSSTTYSYRDGHLVYRPCEEHISCGCSDSCGNQRVVKPLPWPESCYKVSAKWGKECADMAVQKAIRDYLIETYRLQDPVVQLANGITVQRTFRVPHSWDLYIKNFKDKRRIFSNFAIA